MSARQAARARRVLVIKLGALGDFVQALRAMAEIRSAHADAHITLLTTAPYADFARTSGLFDAIDADGRPDGLVRTLALARRLRAGRYDRVYDLQTSSRSSQYLYLFAPKLPEWSGVAPGAALRHKNPRRDHMQNLDRLWDQLAEAGIVEHLPEGAAPGPDLGWAVAAARAASPDVFARLAIPERYALLAPGASPGRPRKRWPTEAFAALARELEAMGLTPVVLGGPQEVVIGQAVAAAAPSTILAAGKTELVDVAALGARAAVLIGNDTGPTYLAALAGAPAVVLFSSDSDPALCAPRLPRFKVLQNDDLGDLQPGEVLNTATLLLGYA